MEPSFRERLLRDGAMLDASGATPLSFGDPAREAAAALEGCVAADRSPLGRIRLLGRDRLEFLHRISTGDVRNLRPGEGRLTALLNPKGRILDLLHALAAERALLLVTSAGTGGKVRAWLDGFLFREEVTLEDAGSLPCLGLYGPESPGILGRIAGGMWDDLPPAHHRIVGIAGAPVKVVRTHPIAGCGFLLLGEEGNALPLWEELLRGGAVPAGSEALDRLRIAAGIPEAGKELTEDYNPWEAGLDAAISLTKGCYTGQEVVARLHHYGKVQRRLSGMRLEGTPPPAGSVVFAGDEEIGSVTSAAFSPEGEGSAALGILALRRADPGTEVTVRWPGGETLGRIIPLPAPGPGPLP